MEPFKAGDVVVYLTNGREGTVAECLLKGDTWMVRIEGAPKGHLVMADICRLRV